jgi:hypothetical protein
MIGVVRGRGVERIGLAFLFVLVLVLGVILRGGGRIGVDRGFYGHRRGFYWQIGGGFPALTFPSMQDIDRQHDNY